jgi:hypothetical protein
MRRTSLALFGAILLAVFALAAAGCGGGGDSDNAAATTTTEVTTEAVTTEAATTEAATTEAATTEAATTEAVTTTEATTTSSSGSTGFASAANCRELTALGQKLSAATSGSGSGNDLKKQAQLMQDFADKVPEEIRADFKVLADYIAKYANILGDLKAGETPDPAQVAELQKALTADAAKVSQASQRLSTWATKNCRS